MSFKGKANVQITVSTPRGKRVCWVLPARQRARPEPDHRWSVLMYTTQWRSPSCVIVRQCVTIRQKTSGMLLRLAQNEVCTVVASFARAGPCSGAPFTLRLSRFARGHYTIGKEIGYFALDRGPQVCSTNTPSRSTWRFRQGYTQHQHSVLEFMAPASAAYTAPLPLVERGHMRWPSTSVGCREGTGLCSRVSAP